MIPAMKRCGYHPFPIPMLRNSVKYNGRAACIRNHTCCGFMCPCDAKNGTQNTVIPVALRSGNCELRTNSYAYEVVMDGRRATGVRYFDKEKRPHYQPAEAVVVAASATETARLMFLSKSKLFPDGLGNQNDMLGRCINSHVYCGAWSLFDSDVEREFGPGRRSHFPTSTTIRRRKFSRAFCAPNFTRCPGRAPKCTSPAYPDGARRTRSI